MQTCSVGGEIVVSGAVLISFGFQQEFQKDCFCFFQFNFFFFLSSGKYRDIVDYICSFSGTDTHSMRSIDREQHAGPQGKECVFICSSGICLLCL